MKKALRWAGLALLLLAFVPAALVWLAGREATLAWLAHVIESRAPGVLVLDGVAGSLRGPWRVAHLVYENDSLRLELTDLEVDWDLSQLWRRHVTVRSVRAATLEMRRKAGQRAERTPARPLVPPVSLTVESAQLGRLRLVLPQTYTFHDVQARARATRGPGANALDVQGAANDGHIAVDGHLALGAQRAFTLKAEFAKLDLAAVGALPRSDVTATVSADGRLLPEWQVTAALTLGDSRINNRPLSGGARLEASSGRVHALDASLQLGRNTVTARGSFGTADDKLVWHIDAPALVQLGEGFSGRLRSEGVLRGSFARPALQFSLDAHAVTLLDRHVVRLARGRGELGAGPRDPFAAQVTIEGYALGRFEIDRADASVSGTRERHDVTLRVRNRFLNARAAARGAFDARGWRARILSFTNAGEYQAQLRGEAEVALGKNYFALRDATLSAGPGTVTIHLLERDGAALRARGQAQRVALSYLQTFATDPWPFKSSLTLAAAWDLTAGEHLDGEIHIARERGDVILDTLPPQALGLSALEAGIRIKNDAVDARATVAGELPGEISLRARTQLTRRDGVWGIAPAAPVDVAADAEVPSLAWLGVFTRDRFAFGGRLALHARAGGTFAEPRWRGQARGDELVLRMPEQGLDWRSGVLEAAFRDERLVIERLRLEGGDGAIEARGYFDILRAVAEFDLDAEHLRVLHTPLREVVAGGKGKVALRNRRLDVSGQVRVERARIELPKRAAPTLSDDIVIVGQEEAAVAPPRKRKLPVQPVLDVHVDLGEKFYLKGAGLDARLAGNLRLRAAETGLPQASGSIRVAAGKYSAYGQSLDVERGILTFSGPIDNPGLNILALRKNQPVLAGVSISGTALAPVVKLVAYEADGTQLTEAGVSDSEKLSWLVLGHGLDEASGAEIDLLGTAAAALLGQGESVSLQARIAQQAGLDEFRLKGGGGLEGAIVTLGKRVSSDVYLTYERSVTGTGNLLRLRYTLTPAWSLQTETGSRDTAVDLFYTFSFD